MREQDNDRIIARILIVEDDQLQALSLQKQLAEMGYEVVGIAATAAEAVSKAHETNPHVVLMDIRLGGRMDGIEAARVINTTLYTAIVYLTAHFDRELFSMARDTGPHGYLNKPVSLFELERAVEMAVYKHEMEKRLRESERRFRAIFDQTYQFIGLMTPEGILLEANKAALEFHGMTTSDVLGMPFWKTPWWTHSSELQNELREEIKRAAAGEFVRFEAFHPAPDGDIRYFDVSIKPVMDDQGNVTLLIPEGRDITERKKAEDRLRESEEKYRLLFSQESDPIFLFDVETLEFKDANQAATRLYGYSHEEFMDMKIFEVSAEPEETIQKAEEAVEKERMSIPLRWHKKKDGLVFPVEISAAAFRWKSREVVCAIIRDVSERKRAELERESLVVELQQALTEVKKLSGLLPICASCKKVRDDKGYWQQIEAYIRDHSEAEFTHSLCPQCAEELYPGTRHNG